MTDVVTVLGGGVTGLWMTNTLLDRGQSVRLVRPANPQTRPASWYAGGMLAPFCEGEAAEDIVVTLGQRSIALWQAMYPSVQVRGSLVLAGARDRTELNRFERLTNGHVRQSADDIGVLEPELEGRFRQGLFFSQEAHLSPRDALAFLEARVVDGGVAVVDGDASDVLDDAGTVIDCRGLGARADLTGLRGVRGEMAVLYAPDVRLTRPIRLLHPRFPLYVVPWGEDRYMVGATLVERDDAGPMTVRSALDLLGHAYTLHPGFGEAEIASFGAGVRPSFADNTPRIVMRGARLYINGMYRHGFLTAPALAELAADCLETGATASEVFVGDCCERPAPGDGRPDAA